jgi:hypothetical protein
MVYRAATKIHAGLNDIAAPILWQQAFTNEAMKRGVGPIANALRQSVLDRIEMDVFHVPGEIVVVADGVLPKSPLPKREIAIWAYLISWPARMSSLLKCPLIRCHRPEKSASFGGKVRMA